MWGIVLRRESEVPLKRQIYLALRDLILEGRIKAGEALPSTREMAKELAISRNTVCEAYEMLLAEGFVFSRQGSPTRVAEGLCLKAANPEFSPEPAQLTQTSLPHDLRAEFFSSIETRVFRPPALADFRTGRPDLRQLPRFLWERIMRKTMADMPLQQLGYTGPEGLERLREEIAAWLLRSRGLAANPQDIFITAGATHALHLIADLLYEEGKHILIEDPCHSGMLRTFRSRGYPVYPVPVDAQGFQIEGLQGKNCCAVYVTPSHQFPLGGILPANRRAALIRFARENQAYIVEDDYDSEFRYCGEPVAPLYAMDPLRVIYVGTFSKVLFPGLRIGYTVLPPQLKRRWKYLRMHTDVQNPPFEQAALAEFLHARKLDRYVQKMRKVYGQRRQALLQALAETFGTGWRPWGDAAGLHLVIEFPGRHFDSEFIEQCKRKGIRVTPVEYHSIRKGRHLDKLLLGYGHLEPEEIRKGISVFSEFMKDFC